jgi:hypothetical protein
LQFYSSFAVPSRLILKYTMKLYSEFINLLFVYCHTIHIQDHFVKQCTDNCLVQEMYMLCIFIRLYTLLLWLYKSNTKYLGVQEFSCITCVQQTLFVYCQKKRLQSIYKIILLNNVQEIVWYNICTCCV